MMHVVFVTCLLLASIPHLHAQKGGYENLAKAMANLRIDSAEAHRVEGYLFEDGPISLMLDSGVVVSFKPIKGRIIAAVFEGTGEFTYTPILPVEAINLARFYKERVFRQPIDRVVLFFTSSTMNELFAGDSVSFTLSKAAREFALAQVKDFLSFDDGKVVNDGFARSLLNGYDNALLYLSVHGKDRWHAYAVSDPYDTEPYKLTIREKTGPWIPVCSDPPTSGDLPVYDWGGTDADLVHARQHTLDVKFKGLTMTTSDRIDFAVVTDSLLWVNLALYPTLRVDSVRIPGVGQVEFFRPDKSYGLWVRLPRTYTRGETFELVLNYHGDIVKRYRDYTWLESSITWYAAHNYKVPSFFDITFQHEKRYTLASIGDRTSISEDDGIVTQRWVSGRLISNASFHIGSFLAKDLTTPPGVPTSSMLYVTREQSDVVAQDVVQALEFYTELFGPLPIKQLVASEHIGYHGEAFPGLLHLSDEAFIKSRAQDNKDDFFGEQFTSHEVAHQWWGIAVDYKSDRDRWISEGFAEYSCLMYSQLASRDRDKFFYLLRDYRKQIINRTEDGYGSKQARPSIAIGSRASVGGKNTDHNMFVYYKPAWVLHMLRNMMINLKTMDEKPFMSAMAEIYTTYKLKAASTADVQRIMEKHAGIDLTWFFDQWVVGNQIPSYTFAWKSTLRQDGKWVITCRVKQNDVDPEFAMYVPIKIVTKQGGLRLRAMITGAESTFELPAINDEPTEVTFNDLESVLCTVDTEKF